MSPTLLNERGYRIMIHTNDHPPPHVHVIKGGHDARVFLDPVGLMSQVGYNKREISAILKLVQANQVELLKSWNIYYPPQPESGKKQ